MIISFFKFVFRWSENSVRFENIRELAFRRAKFCEILSHSVRYGMFVLIFYFLLTIFLLFLIVSPR